MARSERGACVVPRVCARAICGLWVLSRSAEAMPDANKAQPGAPATEHCWGAQLQCAHEGTCAHRFRPGKRHFKTKFCAECTALLVVPTATRARAERRGVAKAVRQHARRRRVDAHLTQPRVERRMHPLPASSNNTKGCAPPRPGGVRRRATPAGVAAAARRVADRRGRRRGAVRRQGHAGAPRACPACPCSARAARRATGLCSR